MTKRIPLSPKLAADIFLKTWATDENQPHLADDIATGLTCTEAEALADLIVSLGVMLDIDTDAAAEYWITQHAQGDDCGDMHCLCGCEHEEES